MSFKANDNYSSIFWDGDKNKTCNYKIASAIVSKFFIFTRIFLIYPEVSFVVLFHDIPLATHN